LKAASFHPNGAVFFTIRHKNMQFIPEMGWIATFLWLSCVQLAKHFKIRKDEKVKFENGSFDSCNDDVFISRG
jgi:hypothetical protein